MSNKTPDLSSSSSPLVKIEEPTKQHGETWSKGTSKPTKGRANSVCSSTPFLARPSLSSRQALPTPIFFQKPDTAEKTSETADEHPHVPESPTQSEKKKPFKKKKSCPQILQIFKDVGPTKKELLSLLQSSPSQSKSKEKLERDGTTVFGISLEKLMKREKAKGNLLEIPYIVYFFVEYIRSNGIDACGIFRQSGHHTKQLEIESIIDSGIDLKNISFDDADIHTIANILKNYLRSLPGPIIPRLPYFSLLAQVSAFSDENLRLACYKMIINALPSSRYELLKYLIEFLHEIANNSIKNLMSASNIALIFAPIIFGSLEDDSEMNKDAEIVIDPIALFKESKFISNITQQFIDFPLSVFDDIRKPPAAFRANECYKSSEEPAAGGSYISLLRGDYVIVIKDLGNGDSLVLAEATAGTLPNSIFITLAPIDFVDIQAKDITFLFTSKISSKPNSDKKDKITKRGGSFTRLFTKELTSSPRRKNSAFH